MFDLRDCTFEDAPTNLCSIQIRREMTGQLLPWMNVVSEIAQMLAELVHVFFDVPQFFRDLNQSRQFPFKNTTVPSWFRGAELADINSRVCAVAISNRMVSSMPPE